MRLSPQYAALELGEDLARLQEDIDQLRHRVFPSNSEGGAAIPRTAGGW